MSRGSYSAEVGEAIYLHWDGEPAYYLVRGHLPKAMAVAAWRARDANFDARHVGWYLGHARNVLARPGDDFDRRLVLCERGRGAFEVTILDVDHVAIEQARRAQVAQLRGEGAPLIAYDDTLPSAEAP